MGVWSQASRSHVAHMRGGDFYSSEKSTVVDRDCSVSIEFEDKATGEKKILKQTTPLLKGEVIDGMFMSCKALRAFFEEQMNDAKETDILFSLHVKATMMKVSHPIVFGHAVTVFYKRLFDKWGDVFDEIGVNANNGLGNVYTKIQHLPHSKRAEIEADIRACYINRPEIAMVDSDRGISNLHVPSDVIVDASMPAMIRSSGQMWGADGKLKDTKAVIPESTYATIYQEVINFCKTHGAFDPRTMGSVPNVGLMAQKAEEYGSHDKTFELEADECAKPKMSQFKTWVKLAVKRARITNRTTVFWLDHKRAHDMQLIHKVRKYLLDHDTEGLDIKIMPPVTAIRYTMERLIEELGTSAKMLSVVPLMKGGGMFETGAGGSAPKHVQQFNEENYLRWDSLAEALDKATGELLNNNKSPQRKIGMLDNRGSHFYLALYWAKALAEQDEDAELKAAFTDLSAQLAKDEDNIVTELNSQVNDKSVYTAAAIKNDADVKASSNGSQSKTIEAGKKQTSKTINKTTSTTDSTSQLNDKKPVKAVEVKYPKAINHGSPLGINTNEIYEQDATVMPIQKAIIQVLYDGEGKLEYQQNVDVVAQKKGEDTIQLTARADGFMTAALQIVESNPDNPLRNIRILLPGGICQGKPFKQVAD
ncbi:Isocitrate dehydrogenase [NADP] 2 [Nymphon striatum]|nr:Isocitrate dehydrogenase [NADP] 2 [Nymphon striatum]